MKRIEEYQNTCDEYDNEIKNLKEVNNNSLDFNHPLFYKYININIYIYI